MQASVQGSRGVKAASTPNGDAPALVTDQQTPCATAQTEEISSSKALANGHLTDTIPSSSLKTEQDQGSRFELQNLSTSQNGHSEQNRPPCKQSCHIAASTHKLDSSPRDGSDAFAWVSTSEGNNNKKVVPLLPILNKFNQLNLSLRPDKYMLDSAGCRLQ